MKKVINIDLIHQVYFSKIDKESVHLIMNTLEIIKVEWAKIDNSFYVTGHCTSSKKEIITHLQFSPRSKQYILGQENTCICNKQEINNCIHMYALIYLVSQYTLEELENFQYQDKKKTSQELLFLQNEFIQDYEKVNAQEKYKIDIQLEILQDKIKLKFSIGYEKGKKYFVKSMKKFIESLIEEEPVTYSKYFICSNKLSDFNKNQQKLLELLIYSNELISFEKSEMVIENENADLLIENLLEEEVEILTMNEKYKSKKVSIGVNPYTIRITENEANKSIRLCNNVQLLVLTKMGIIYLQEDTLYYYRPTNYRVLKFIRTIMHKELTINNEEEFLIFDNVLRPLETTFDFQNKYIYDEILMQLQNIVINIDYVNNNHLTVEIDKLEEKKYSIYLYKQIESLLTYYGDQLGNVWKIYDPDKIYDFSKFGVTRLYDITQSINVTPRFENIIYVPESQPKISVKKKSSLFEINIEYDDLTHEKLNKILTKYRRKEKYHLTEDGRYIELDNKSIKQLEEIYSQFNIDITKEKYLVSKYKVLFVKNVNELLNNFDFELEDNLIESVGELEKKEYVIPSELNGELRSYQRDGFNFLSTMYDANVGAVLADDMGLGKTFQMISLILSRNTEENMSLIVCPTSLMINWKNEFHKFAPTIKVKIVEDTVTNREKIIQKANSYDVLITSYELLKRDVKKYEDLEFDVFVLDEAQYIKNFNTKNYKSVKRIKSYQRYALSGTLIENNISELWSIFDFIMPGFLMSYSKFYKFFEQPIEIEKNLDKKKILKKLVEPYILRRLKLEVLNDFPNKEEKKILVKMDKEHESLYNANIDEVQREIQNLPYGKKVQSKMKILAMLMKLRQLSCDPRILYDNYEIQSNKFKETLKIVNKHKEEKKKILIFSQFTTMIDLLEEEFIMQKISYYILTGKTKASDRNKMVESFNEDDTTVFLISLKAGGVGLNLVGANIVIHYDPWWNLSIQNQATDRAYRIGQESDVTVYKLIVKDSIEEKIVNLQNEKAQLAMDILDPAKVQIKNLNNDELMKLLIKE